MTLLNFFVKLGLIPPSVSSLFNLFWISTITSGNNDILMVYIHCRFVNGTSSNTFAIEGIITTIICNNVPSINAPIKYLLSHNPALNIDSSLLIAMY